MQKITLFKIVFVAAVLAVGIVYSALPHLVRYEVLKEQGIRYVPLTVQSTFDHINIHAARYRDIVDGRLIPGEMDTYEHREGPILWPILSATILMPFFLPFQSVFPGFILTDFLFPILLFLSLFALSYTFTRNKFFSLFSAYIVMLFPQIGVLIPPSSFTELKILFFEFLPFSDTLAASLSFLARDSFIPNGPFFVFMFYCTYQALTIEFFKRGPKTIFSLKQRYWIGCI